MGFVSCQEDNQDARDESLRRSSRQQTKKTAATVSKPKKSRPTDTPLAQRTFKRFKSKSQKSQPTKFIESQRRLRRSPDSTRVNKVARPKQLLLPI